MGHGAYGHAEIRQIFAVLNSGKNRGMPTSKKSAKIKAVSV